MEKRICLVVSLLAVLLWGCTSNSSLSGPRTLTLDVTPIVGNDFFENWNDVQRIDSDPKSTELPILLLEAIEAIYNDDGIPVRDILSSETTEMVISEDMTADGFTSWYCVDSIYGTKLGLEFGYYSDPRYEGVFGFLLYDGSDKGIRTLYKRVGLEHHWSWIGDDFDESFTFVISPEGYGRYYDFTNVPDGESIKPRDVYKVRKR